MPRSKSTPKEDVVKKGRLQGTGNKIHSSLALRGSRTESLYGKGGEEEIRKTIRYEGHKKVKKKKKIIEIGLH